MHKLGIKLHQNNEEVPIEMPQREIFQLNILKGSKLKKYHLLAKAKRRLVEKSPT